MQEENGHITAASPASTLESYTYNALGNITDKSDIGAYTYAGNTGSLYANPHAATTINGSTYTYDKNGNLTNKASWGYVWDHGNRMTSATTSGQTVSFEYDHQGSRTKLADGSTTRRYPSKYYDTDGTTPTKHIYLPSGALIATIEGTGTVAALSYVHIDHLGGTQAVTNDGGARSQFVVTNDGGARSQFVDYWPFGGTRVDQQFTDTSERHKFTGHQLDDQTGLYYMQARYQNPKRRTLRFGRSIIPPDRRSRVQAEV